MKREPEIVDAEERTVGILTGLTDDGREFIPLYLVVEYPWLRIFLARFSNYYIFDPLTLCWFGPAPESKTLH